MSIDPIAWKLRVKRFSDGRSQASVAADAGVGQSMVSEWETGTVMPSLASVRSWARALGFDVVLAPLGPGSSSPEPGPAHTASDDPLYREPPQHFGEMEHRRPACTCPPPRAGSSENRGHLLGCPVLRAESTKDEERTKGGA